MDKGIKNDGNRFALGYRLEFESFMPVGPEHDDHSPALNGDEIFYHGYFIPVKKNSIY